MPTEIYLPEIQMLGKYEEVSNANQVVLWYLVEIVENKSSTSYNNQIFWMVSDEIRLRNKNGYLDIGNIPNVEHPTC